MLESLTSEFVLLERRGFEVNTNASSFISSLGNAYGNHKLLTYSPSGNSNLQQANDLTTRHASTHHKCKAAHISWIWAT